MAREASTKGLSVALAPLGTHLQGSGHGQGPHAPLLHCCPPPGTLTLHCVKYRKLHCDLNMTRSSSYIVTLFFLKLHCD